MCGETVIEDRFRAGVFARLETPQGRGENIEGAL